MTDTQPELETPAPTPEPVPEEAEGAGPVPTPEEAEGAGPSASALPEGEATQEDSLPLGVSLLLQTRRVREFVLPQFYQASFNGLATEEHELAIVLMQGALTTAEQALLNQDYSQLVFAHHMLSQFDV